MSILDRSKLFPTALLVVTFNLGAAAMWVSPEVALVGSGAILFAGFCYSLAVNT